MRPRFPLSAKILFWLFANLLIVAIAAWLFLAYEFHIGIESLLGGRAGKRIDALGELVQGELAATPEAQWSGVLSRAGTLYGLHLTLLAPDGSYIAGEQITLPDPVKARTLHFHPPPRPGMPGPGGPPPPPPQDDSGGPMPPPPPMAFGVDSQPPNNDGGPPAPAHAGPHLMLRTDHPTRYWLLLGLNPGPGFRPVTLVAVSESIGLGGLIVDFAPWLAAVGAIILFSLLWWLPLVRGITHSIREMTAATGRIADGRFDIRVRDQRTDEIGLLATSVNQMAERLSGFVTGQKRFLGDIAHELCSPLARAQMALGILEREAAGTGLADLREEIQQMSGLVNELLSFSKTSLAAGRVELVTLSLAEQALAAIDQEALGGAGIQVRIPLDLRVRADEVLLRRAIANLLRNAVKYAGHAGPIEVTAGRAGSDAILTIADHGPGVPEDALAQIFDPFYRVDISRARETGGTGLGLAIVKTCVEACGGRVQCRNRKPSGLAVLVTLPAA